MTHPIEFDEPKCVAAGQCVMVAPDVFDQRDDDCVAIVLDETPAETLLADVEEAAAVCPAAALRVVPVVTRVARLGEACLSRLPCRSTFG